MGLDGQEILKSTNLELKVSLFDKALQIGICCVFPCQLSLCDISDVTNVESELVCNNALVLMDFDPFETMTWIICRYVLGEMILEWVV